MDGGYQDRVRAVQPTDEMIDNLVKTLTELEMIDNTFMFCECYQRFAVQPLRAAQLLVPVRSLSRVHLLQILPTTVVSSQTCYTFAVPIWL